MTQNSGPLSDVATTLGPDSSEGRAVPPLGNEVKRNFVYSSRELWGLSLPVL